jgi:hypothetical protein
MLSVSWTTRTRTRAGGRCVGPTTFRTTFECRVDVDLDVSEHPDLLGRVRKHSGFVPARTCCRVWTETHLKQSRVASIMKLTIMENHVQAARCENASADWPQIIHVTCLHPCRVCECCLLSLSADSSVVCLCGV